MFILSMSTFTLIILRVTIYTYITLIFFFFFNDTATTEIYTLSLHDALPICRPAGACRSGTRTGRTLHLPAIRGSADRKSTRLNSSHSSISYAVFCLKKKKKKIAETEIIKKIIFIHMIKIIKDKVRDV